VTLRHAAPSERRARRRFIPLLIALATLAPFAGGCRHSATIRPATLVFGSAGEHDGEFHMPREVGFSPDGSRLYILDRSHRVQVFRPDGTFVTGWATPPGQLGNPRGLDVDNKGNLYVADTHNSQILVYTPEGKLLRKWGKSGKAPGEFISVTDVTVAPNGNIWTCEYGSYNDRIQEFTPEGKHLLTYGTFGNGKEQLSRPQGIAVDHEGLLYVADAVNHRVQVLSPKGMCLRTFGGVGSSKGQLRYPYDVAFDKFERLYVAEFGNSRVSIFDKNGTYLTGFGRAGHETGEFDHPWGVNIAPNGEIYVADTMNYRIQKFPPLDAPKHVAGTSGGQG
jgi:DNA-binding beta-propeller fold protein YncE